MDSTDDRRISDARTAAMFNALKSQRDQAANALVEQIGLNAQIEAAWDARWSDLDALEARVAELNRSA